VGDDGEILIEYAAVPSPRARGAWAPALWVNGRKRVEWSALDEMEAREQAQESAHEEAARYVGDWTVTVQARAA
jgi:hypothetical protein